MSLIFFLNEYAKFPKKENITNPARMLVRKLTIAVIKQSLSNYKTRRNLNLLAGNKQKNF